MGQSLAIPRVIPNNWKRLDLIVNKIKMRLGRDANPTFAGFTLTGLTASTLIGADADKALESVTIGTGLDYTRPTLSLSHLGIEALTDPGADKILFWDDSASACAWLSVGNSVAITDVTVDTIQDIRTTASPTFAKLTLSTICTAAAGLNVLRVTGLQTDGTAMTGTLRGAYIDVSNGSTAATGTIRGMELKARTEAPGDIGNDVTVLEGLSISADSKGHSVTTMRAAEFILDGSAGGTITEAVGLRIANNLQANKATTSYGIQIYRDSFDYTADIQLSNSGTIGGSAANNIMMTSTNGRFICEDSQADNTTKSARWGIEHYNTAEKPFFFLYCVASDGNNVISLGGGTGLGNAATALWYRIANDSTSEGTVVGNVEYDKMTFGADGIPYHVTVLGTTLEAGMFFINTDHENTDGGRLTQIRFYGQKGDGTEHRLVQINAYHKGTGDDYRGELLFRINDGTNAGTPAVQALIIDNAGSLRVSGDVYARDFIMLDADLIGDSTEELDVSRMYHSLDNTNVTSGGVIRAIGYFSSAGDVDYKIEITTGGNLSDETAKFRWSDDGGSSWNESDLDLETFHDINNGLTLIFTGVLGFNDFNTGDYTTFTAIGTANRVHTLVVNTTDTRVGIGKTPTVTFDVAGQAAISGSLTLGANLIISDAGYIGSTSDTDAIQIEADGDVVLTQDLTVSGIAGIGAAPNTDMDLYVYGVHSSNAASQYGIFVDFIQDTATAFPVVSFGTVSASTHTSGSIAALYGYYGGSYAKSSSNVATFVGMFGEAKVTAAYTPTITVATGLMGSVTLAGASATLAFSIQGNGPTVGAGSVTTSASGYFADTVAGTHNWGVLSAGDVGIFSNKKLNFEAGLISTGNTYLVYDSGNATLDCFVNATEAWNADTSRIEVLLDIEVANGEFFVFDKASGNGIKVDTTTPTFGWADLQGNITNSKGATKPSEVTYQGGITQFQFSAGDDAELEFHIPHDYVPGTDIHLHVHWSHIGTLVTGGTLTFTVESSCAKGHNQGAFSAPATGTFTGTASTTQYQHIVSETQFSASSPAGLQVDTDDLEPDGIIMLRFEVTTNSITVSSGGVPDPFIHHIDIHYQTTGLIGTKQKAPDFYT